MILTDTQVLHEFGDPAPYVGADGHIEPEWEVHILTAISLPLALPLAGGGSVTHVRCHRRIAAALSQAFNTLYVNGSWPLLKDYGGCYCWRTQRMAAHERSRHSWGIAIDLNVRDNPMMGTPKMPPAIVDAFKRAGFAWGGDFVHRPDGMHFEANDLTKLTGAAS